MIFGGPVVSEDFSSDSNHGRHFIQRLHKFGGSAQDLVDFGHQMIDFLALTILYYKYSLKCVACLKTINLAYVWTLYKQQSIQPYQWPKKWLYNINADGLKCV